ncbi:MAG: TolC family protein, partial [Gammaproteobacteria bacterium]|nr:TolC family protein [Gammaproteobacteria bacterium]
PTDTFKREQEPMTQVQVGIQQAIPRGDTLAIKSRQTSILSEGVRYRGTDRQLEVLRDVRKNWLEAYYWSNALTVVNETRSLFNQLVSITESHYSTGKRNQQDVIRAALELGLLDDRKVKIKQEEEKARARLSRWVGNKASGSLPKELPTFSVATDRNALNNILEQHPKLQMRNALVNARQAGVDLARESYKPAWMIDLTYGMRDGNNANGTERADLASAMLIFDLPLFTSKRQDKQLSASQHELAAVMYERDDVRLNLATEMDLVMVMEQRLAERKTHFKKLLVPQADANASAALNAYQSDETDFATLMRAQITQLETRLNALRVQVDYAKAQADLLYLTGETK